MSSLGRPGRLLLLRAVVVGGLVLSWAGPGVLVLESLVRRVDVPGSRHFTPCLRSACAEACLEDAACWPLRSEENGAWWAPHLAITFICVRVIYTMVMVVPTRRTVSTSPAGCPWTLVCVATSGPC